MRRTDEDLREDLRRYEAAKHNYEEDKGHPLPPHAPIHRWIAEAEELLLLRKVARAARSIDHANWMATWPALDSTLREWEASDDG